MDGTTLADKKFGELKDAFAKLKRPATLAVVRIGTDPVGTRFIAQKKKAAETLGVHIIEKSFSEKLSGKKLRELLGTLAHDKSMNGIIIQLPLPSHVNTQDVLNAIPPEKDVDLLSTRSIGNFAAGKTICMSPVVGAIADLAMNYTIDFKNKNIVVVGGGRLVGKPVASWLLQKNLGFTLVTEETTHPEEILQRADIIITGVGKKVIDGSMIKPGAAIFDAGTSESGGQIHGDVDFDSVFEKASFLTPVPGGIGPLTVVWIFKNLLSLMKG